MEERQSMSVEDAAQGLMRVEPEGQPEAEEQEADVTEAEADGEEIEAEAEEVETDDPEAETDDDSEPEAEPEETEEDDDPLLTMPDGKEVKFSELQAGYMRQKDYTQKTQALANERREFEALQDKVTQHLQQQNAQLKDALATFAIDQEKEPDWENLSPEQYVKERARWDRKASQKQQAQQLYQQLQQRQHQEVLEREKRALLNAFPEWNDPEAFAAAGRDFVALGTQYGFSPDEMGAIVDHRMFKILDRLSKYEKAEAARKANAAKVTKKVTKAAKKPAPGSKPAKNQKSDVRRQHMDRLKKTGSLRDAALAILEPNGP